MNRNAKQDDQDECRQRTDTSRHEKPRSAGADRDDDENDFSTLQHRNLKRGTKSDTVEAPYFAEFLNSLPLLCKSFSFIMKRNDTR